MKIVKQTPTELILRLANNTLWLMFGGIILVAGLVAVIWIRPQVPRWAKPEVATLIERQSEDVNLETASQNTSTEKVGLDLAGQTAAFLFNREWQLFLVGLVGLIGGGMMMVGPLSGSRSVKFDKSSGQVVLTQPGWFFRSNTEVYCFEDISEVRVERDRVSTGRNDKSYRVSLVFSHHEGIPLSPNYVHYKTVFPFSRYQYDYQSTQSMAAGIRAFLNEDLKRGVCII